MKSIRYTEVGMGDYYGHSTDSTDSSNEPSNLYSGLEAMVKFRVPGVILIIQLVSTLNIEAIVEQ